MWSSQSGLHISKSAELSGAGYVARWIEKLQDYKCWLRHTKIILWDNTMWLRRVLDSIEAEYERDCSRYPNMRFGKGSPSPLEKSVPPPPARGTNRQNRHIAPYCATGFLKKSLFGLKKKHTYCAAGAIFLFRIYQNKAISRHLALQNRSKPAPQAKIWAIFAVAQIDFAQFLKGKITHGKVFPPPPSWHKSWISSYCATAKGGQTDEETLLRLSPSCYNKREGYSVQCLLKDQPCCSCPVGIIIVL